MAALVKCRDCGQKVSKRAEKCPNCGAPLKKKPSGCFSTIVLVVCVGVIIAVISTCNDTSNQNTAKHTATIDKSPSMQADRLKLIERLQQEGVFGEIRARSSGATIIVRPAFYALDFKDKQSFVSVVYAYYFDGSDKYTPITLKDSRTNKKVGSFSSAFGLDLE